MDREFDALLGHIFGRGRPGPLNLWAKATPAALTKTRSQFADFAKLSVTPDSADLSVSIAAMIFNLQKSAWLRVSPFLHNHCCRRRVALCAGGIDEEQIKDSLAVFNADAARHGRPPVLLAESDLILPEPARLFDDVLAKIVSEFRTHVDPIPVDKKPSAVLLVGGFADSPVVQARLRAEFGRVGVRVETIPDAWQAVVKGAVLFALRPRAIRARRMRHAFGLVVAEPWDATLHDAHVVSPAELGCPSLLIGPLDRFVIAAFLHNDRWSQGRTSTPEDHWPRRGGGQGRGTRDRPRFFATDSQRRDDVHKGLST